MTHKLPLALLISSLMNSFRLSHSYLVVDGDFRGSVTKTSEKLGYIPRTLVRSGEDDVAKYFLPSPVITQNSAIHSGRTQYFPVNRLCYAISVRV